jgi:hypothetical protein
LVYFGCSSRVLEYEERESSCQGFCEGMSSSSVQQVQFPCAGCNSFLDHKDNSFTTATWGIGRPTMRSLLLLVCLHSHLHCTHQQLLQYTALLPRARPLETKAPLRDQGRFPGGQREKLWRELFLDPSQWSDHRSEKENARYSDFKHKKTGEALWLEDR